MHADKCLGQTFYQSSQSPCHLNWYCSNCGFRRKPQIQSCISLSKKKNHSYHQNNSFYFHKMCSCIIKTKFRCSCNCYLPSLYKKLISAPYTKLKKKMRTVKKQKQNITIINKHFPIITYNCPEKSPIVRTVFNNPPLIHQIQTAPIPIVTQYHNPPPGLILYPRCFSQPSRVGHCSPRIDIIRFPSSIIKKNYTENPLTIDSITSSNFTPINSRKKLKFDELNNSSSVMMKKFKKTLLNSISSKQDGNLVTFREIPTVIPEQKQQIY